MRLATKSVQQQSKEVDFGPFRIAFAFGVAFGNIVQSKTYYPAAIWSHLELSLCKGKFALFPASETAQNRCKSGILWIRIASVVNRFSLRHMCESF